MHARWRRTASIQFLRSAVAADASTHSIHSILKSGTPQTPRSTRRSLAGGLWAPFASPVSPCSNLCRSAAVGSRSRRSPYSSVGCRLCPRRSGRVHRPRPAWRRPSAGRCCGLASLPSRSPAWRTPATETTGRCQITRITSCMLMHVYKSWGGTLMNYYNNNNCCCCCCCCCYCYCFCFCYFI